MKDRSLHRKQSLLSLCSCLLFACRVDVLVAVIVWVDDVSAFPCKQPVTNSSSKTQRDAKVRVVRHENKHEAVTEEEVEDVQASLKQVRRIHQL